MLSSSFLVAQENIDKLIFSEIYLDEDNPAMNWIEIYNPTQNTLILERLRLSKFLSPNALPSSIKEKGGLPIKPHEFIVICANKSSFNAAYEYQTNLYEISWLNMLLTGGFIAIETKSSESEIIDAVRYGDPLKSTIAEKFAGKQVLEYLKDGKGFSRKVIRKNESITFFDYFEAAPTPGYIIYGEL